MKNLLLTLSALILLSSCGKGADWHTKSCGENTAFKWYSHRLEYSIDTSALALSEDIKAAIDEVNTVVGYELVVLNSSSDNKITIVDLNPDGHHVINGRNSVNYYNFAPVKSTIFIDTHIAVNLKTVLKHEIVHSLGLTHSRDESSIMYTYNNSMDEQIIDTTTANTIRCLYTTKE